MKPRLYHNNNCSKSRMCKKILEDNNIDFEIREYLKDQMTKNEIKNIQESLGKNNLDLEKSVQPGLTGRRSLYVVKNIKKGERFTVDNVKSIRPVHGLHPKYLKRVLNKTATQNINAGSRLEKNLISDF